MISREQAMEKGRARYGTVKNHTNECRICGKIFDTSSELTKHFVTAHKD